MEFLTLMSLIAAVIIAAIIGAAVGIFVALNYMTSKKSSVKNLHEWEKKADSILLGNLDAADTKTKTKTKEVK